MSDEVRCANCGKLDERKVKKPLCLDCYEQEVDERHSEQGYRGSIRNEMRHDRLRDLQVERVLSGQWPIVSPHEERERE